MRRFSETIVQETEIDSLGHMNVRFYMERAQRANRDMMEDLGLNFAEMKARGLKLTQVDSYNRYHREQFAGASLFVQGGVVDVGESGATMYFEVRNAQTDECAAAFILKYALIEGATRTPRALPAGFAARAESARIAIPGHGRPRSLDLLPPRLDVSYESVLARVGDGAMADMLNRRMEREVEPEDCDAYGFLDDDQDMSFSLRRMAKMPAGESWGPPVFTTDEGHRFAWAWLETRMVRLSQPRAGDVLRIIGAEIGVQLKTRHSRRWVFNATAGRLASLTDTIGIALDLDARRPIAIPAKVRAALEASHTPEFA